MFRGAIPGSAKQSLNGSPGESVPLNTPIAVGAAGFLRAIVIDRTAQNIVYLKDYWHEFLFIQGEGISLATVLFILALFVVGCDTDRDDTVTGDYVSQEPRGLFTIEIPPDSVYIGSPYRKNVGSSTYALAGRYQNTEAFSVFKFSLSRVKRETLLEAWVELDIGDCWKDGAVEFDIFDTHTSWSDSTGITPDDFFGSLGGPAGTTADTASVISRLRFDVDPAIIDAWEIYGAFLIRASAAGDAMVSILSDDTNYPPVLDLVKRTSTGIIDTVSVRSHEGTFYYSSGLEDRNAVTSQGNGAGFVMRIALPETLPPYAYANRCLMSLSIDEVLMPDEIMTIKIYKLNAAFTTRDEANYDSGESLLIQLQPDVMTYTIDLTQYINAWHIGGHENFGMLWETSALSDSPSQCVVVPGDSLFITYTPFPEIR